MQKAIVNQDILFGSLYFFNINQCLQTSFICILKGAMGNSLSVKWGKKRRVIYTYIRKLRAGVTAEKYIQ